MSFPTVYQGDVRITTNVDPVTYGAGNLRVDNNLLVTGAESNHQVTNLWTKDNIIGLNEPPPSTGRDLGYLASRHPTDVVTDIPAETGTAISGTINTIVLAVTADPTDDFYNGWVITITAGTGIGQTRTIVDYIGATNTATVDTNYAPVLDATSVYALFDTPRVGTIWSEGQKEMQMILTPQQHTDVVVPVVSYAELHVHRLIQELAEECVYYVGMHGDDSNNGFHIMQAKKTFGNALAAAAAEMPDITNQIAVVCFDGCTYNESISISSFIHVRALSAVLVGTITINDKASIHFGGLRISTPQAMVSSGTTTININTVDLLGSTNGLIDLGNCTFKSDVVNVENGIACLDVSNMNIGNINISGTGTAVKTTTLTNGTIGRIVGTGTAFDVPSGTINVNANSINTTTAYTIGASGNLNVYTGSISGTQTILLGGVSNVLPANLLTNKGDLYTRQISGADNKIVRFPVSNDQYILYCDSAEPTGIKWAPQPGALPGLLPLRLSYTLISTYQHPDATGDNWNAVAYFPWSQKRYAALSASSIVYRARIPPSLAPYSNGLILQNNGSGAAGDIVEGLFDAIFKPYMVGGILYIDPENEIETQTINIIGYIDSTHLQVNTTRYTPITLPYEIYVPPYITGTASQVGNIVTGVGTSWTSDMIGGLLIFENYLHGVIYRVDSGTQLRIHISQSVASQNYSITYPGLVFEQGTISQSGFTITNDTMQFSWINDPDVGVVNGILIYTSGASVGQFTTVTGFTDENTLTVNTALSATTDTYIIVNIPAEGVPIHGGNPNFRTLTLRYMDFVNNTILNVPGALTGSASFTATVTGNNTLTVVNTPPVSGILRIGMSISGAGLTTGVSFTAGISFTSMIVSAATPGSILMRLHISGPGIIPGTIITQQISGTPGGIGNYVVSRTHNTEPIPGTSMSVAGIFFTGGIELTTLTVTAAPFGILLGVPISGSGVIPGTTITTQLTGPPLGIGTYTVSNSHTTAPGPGTMITGPTVTFSGEFLVAGNTLTVYPPTNRILLNMLITGAGILPATVITSQISGLTGYDGTYLVNNIHPILGPVSITVAAPMYIGSIYDTTLTIDPLTPPNYVLTLGLDGAGDISGTGITPGTKILAQLSGLPGEDGDYLIDTSHITDVLPGTSISTADVPLVGSIVATTLTVTSVTGLIFPNLVLSGMGVIVNTVITIQLTGPPGGIGTYTVSNLHTTDVPAGTLLATSDPIITDFVSGIYGLDGVYTISYSNNVASTAMTGTAMAFNKDPYTEIGGISPTSGVAIVPLASVDDISQNYTYVSTVFDSYNPITDTSVQLQFQQNGLAGSHPIVLGCVIEYRG